jgi:hypothetical protein
MQVEAQLLSAILLVTEDEQCRNIFDAMLREGGKTSGWSVTKVLGLDPEILKTGLDKMKAHNILESTGPGLDGYYYLTPLGFKLRSALPR